jgi:hypothetical protein
MTDKNKRRFARRLFAASMACFLTALTVRAGAEVGIQPPEIAAWTSADRQAALEKGHALRAALRQAVESGSKEFVIPKDDYLLREAFVFDGLKGMHINGSGATFWTVGEGELEFSNCVDCVVEDLTLDRLQYPFIQGVVSEIVPGGAASGGDRIVLDLDKGSMPADAKEKIGRTLCRSARTGKYYYRPEGFDVDRTAPKKPGQWVWHNIPSMVEPRAPRMEVGDQVSMHVSVSGSAGLDVFECENMQFNDVNVYSAAGFLVKESGIRSPGGNTYRRLKIIPRPGTSRLSTSTMDGFHSYNQHKGPTLIDCEIAGTYDDGINIHGFMNVILKKISPTELIICSQFGRDYAVGTELSFYQKPVMKPSGRAVVTAFEPVAAGQGEPLMNQAVALYKSEYELGIRESGRWMEYYRVSFDRPVDAAAFDMAVSSDYCGRGAHIKGLTMRDGCNRGALIKAPDAVIEDSVFENTFFGALYVTAEMGPIEGDFADRVVIRNNRFSECCYYSLRTKGNLWSSISPITVLASVAPKPINAYLHIGAEHLFEGLLIENNLIEDSPGIALFAANLKDSVIRNNRIVRPFQEEWLYPQINLAEGNRLERTYAPALTAEQLQDAASPLFALYVVAGENVTVSGNVVEGLPPGAKGTVGVGAWCRDVAVSE